MAAIVTALSSIYVVALVFLFYVVVGYVNSVCKLRATLYQWPGLTGHWLFGNAKQHPMSNPKIRAAGSEASLAFTREMTAKYPRGYYWFQGPFGGRLVANHPDIIRAIIKGKEPKPLTLGAPYRFLLPWLGKGLLLAGGSTWLRNRRLITHAFHFDVLKTYMKVYNKATDVLLTKMEGVAASGESFEVTKNISMCTLDILLRCIFSYETDCQNSHSPKLFLDFIFNRTNKGKTFYKEVDFVHNISGEVIQTRRAKPEEKKADSDSESLNGKHLDFLDILLSARDEDGNGLTDLQIRNEVDTFLFEGHDTTAGGLTWMLYVMAKHPEHQKKVQEEIDQVLEGRDSDEILWEDLGKFKYLVQCLKEAMRLYPPVPFIQRVLGKDIIVDGKVLPKGTNITLNIYALHHNPEIWPNPLAFLPDRFSPENLRTMDPFAYLPFSAGPRNCIGQNFALNEEKVILARVLRRFHIELDPNHKVVASVQLVYKAKYDIKIKLKPRF